MRWGAIGFSAITLSACSPSAPQPPEPPTPPATPEQFGVEAPQSPAPSKIPAKVACSSDEQTLFSCDLENGKRIAVCGAGEWLGHYRYGGDTAELELSGGKLANVMYSGGGESQIAFENGDYRYIVFSRIVRTNFKAGEPNKPAISDGLLVLRGEKLLASNLCKADGVQPVDINAANAIWEMEQELFTYETVRADP